MDALLKKSGIRLTPKQLEQLWRYHNLLRKRNEDRDLTRIVGFEPMVQKHYLDCLIVGDLFKLPSPLLDVGTGAGFPGIPLKIRYPHLQITLAEPRPRRVNFLKEAITECRLDRVEVFDHKVVSDSFQKPMAGVITRAVEEMEKTLLRTSKCVREGSRIIFMKGPAVDPEVKVVDRRFGKSFRLVLDKAYTLPHSHHERRLLVYERTAVSHPALDRRRVYDKNPDEGEINDASQTESD
jgi:16S rRNA (guanine(527)-N(7))-methyltransferase RsmG